MFAFREAIVGATLPQSLLLLLLLLLLMLFPAINPRTGLDRAETGFLLATQISCGLVSLLFSHFKQEYHRRDFKTVVEIQTPHKRPL